MKEAFENLQRFFTYYLTMAAVGMGFILLLVVVYWQLYTVPPLSIQTPFTVEPLVASPSGLLSYTLYYDKDQNIPEITSFDYVCPSQTIQSTIQNQYSWLPMGTASYSGSIRVPNKIKPEICHIEAKTTTQPNPLRTFISTYRSIDFWIGDPPKGEGVE